MLSWRMIEQMLISNSSSYAEKRAIAPPSNFLKQLSMKNRYISTTLIMLMNVSKSSVRPIWLRSPVDRLLQGCRRRDLSPGKELLLIRPEPKSKKELFTEKLRFLQSNYDSPRMPLVYFAALSLISGGKRG
jgi:hypothetical protein